MGLNKERLEDPLVRLNLPLQFLVLLRPEAGLPLVRHHLVERDLGSVGSDNRAAESSLLKADDPAAVLAVFGGVHGLFRGIARADDASNVGAQIALCLLQGLDQAAACFPNFAMRPFLGDADIEQSVRLCFD